MIIALDYDGTYTADSELWEAFIDLVLMGNRQIICVTARHDNEHHAIRNMRIPVYYCGNQLKQAFMESIGIKVDIWIDDMPGMIQDCMVLNFDK